jgi:uncharacterized protein YfbU (UPF0304 family)
MPISDSEKLIISLLLDVHKHLGIKNSVDPEFVQDALLYGDMWALKQQYPGIFGSSPDRDPADVQFVHDALTMWRVLEESYANLSEEEKEKVQHAPGSHGHAPRFEGFDGHSDLVSIANTMINRLGYYDEFAGRPLDAHMPVNEVHERMLAGFMRIREKLHRGYLSADDIISVVNERIHPENR